VNKTDVGNHFICQCL